MEEMKRALVEHKDEKIWYSKLKRLLRNPEYLASVSDSSIREAFRKLKEVPIIVVEKPSSSKKKKLLIHLLPEVVNESSVPDSYLSDSKRKLFNQAADSGKHLSRKRSRDAEKREKIIQSLLFRANAGAAYSRRVDVSNIEPGQVVFFMDKKGYWYYNEYVDAKLTAEQMKELVPISSKIDTIDGISVADLVCHRDAGSGGIFRDLVVSVDEVEDVAKGLISKGYLREMSRDEISSAIDRTETPVRYEQLKKERRYKVANDLLHEYIFDLTDLLYFITRRIRAARMAGHAKAGVDNDWYKYYYGFEALDNLRTYKETEMKRILTVRKNGVTEIATPFGIIPGYQPRKKKSYVRETKEWNECIRKQIDTLISKKEYAQIENKYPLLHGIFMSLVKPVPKKLKLDVNLIMTK
jgi:hypothetical protein